MTIKKLLLVVLVLFAIQCAEAKTIPALPEGFSSSVEAEHFNFELAAFSQDTAGNQITCDAMPRYNKSTFVVPDSAFKLSKAEVHAAYVNCLAVANGKKPAAVKASAKTVAPEQSVSSVKGVNAAPTTSAKTTTPTANVITPNNSAEVANLKAQVEKANAVAASAIAQRDAEKAKAEKLEKQAKDAQGQITALRNAPKPVAQPTAKATADPRVPDLEKQIRELKEESAKREVDYKRKLAEANNKPPDPMLADLQRQIQQLRGDSVKRDALDKEKQQELDSERRLILDLQKQLELATKHGASSNNPSTSPPKPAPKVSSRHWPRITIPGWLYLHQVEVTKVDYAEADRLNRVLHLDDGRKCAFVGGPPVITHSSNNLLASSRELSDYCYEYRQALEGVKVNEAQISLWKLALVGITVLCLIRLKTIGKKARALAKKRRNSKLANVGLSDAKATRLQKTGTGGVRHQFLSIVPSPEISTTPPPPTMTMVPDLPPLIQNFQDFCAAVEKHLKSKGVSYKELVPSKVASTIRIYAEPNTKLSAENVHRVVAREFRKYLLGAGGIYGKQVTVRDIEYYATFAFGLPTAA